MGFRVYLRAIAVVGTLNCGLADVGWVLCCLC